MAPSDGSSPDAAAGPAAAQQQQKAKNGIEELGLKSKDFFTYHYLPPDDMNKLYDRTWDGRRLGKPEKYRWHDSPDGDDCIKKMWYLAKMGMGIGLGVGVLGYKVRLKTGITIAERIFLVGRQVRAGGLCGVAATTTICGLTHLRGVEDPLHHLAGGLSTAVVIGPAWGYWQPAVFLGIFLGIPAYTTKYWHMQGWGSPFNKHIWRRAHYHKRQPFWVRDFNFISGGGYEYEYSEDDGRLVFKVEHYHTDPDEYELVH